MNVLIDTWWNVNEKEDAYIYSIDRFNRYMVECEYIIIGGLDSGTSGFNRYMVECE